MKFTCFLFLFSFLFGLIEDPYEWLEEMNSEKTKTWVENQNQVTHSYLSQIPERKTIEKKLQSISDYENYTLFTQKKERLFFLKKNKGDHLFHLAMDRLNGREAETLLVPQINTPLINYIVSDSGSLICYHLSDKGADSGIWKFLNVETREILPDVIEDIQFSSPVWSSDNRGIYYINYKKGAIYYHLLGSDKDSLVLQVEKEGGNVLLLELFHPSKHFLLFKSFSEQHSDEAVYLFDIKSNHLKQLVSYDRGQYRYVGQINDSLLFWTDFESDRHKIVSYDGSWKDLIPESENTLLDATVVNEKIICHYLEDCSSTLKCFDASGIFLSEILPPRKGTVSLAREAPFFSYTDTTTPTIIYSYNGDIYFESKMEHLTKYVTNQLFFSSEDGTQIPIFVTHRKDLELTGNHPTLLYGYGGFAIPLTPAYSPLTAAWLDMGGIFVLANLRGGGEYGKSWYEAGRGKNKQNTFNDFIAAAQFLIEKGYTCPNKLAIHGRSNGGLLVGACVIQQPTLFTAAIAQVAVFDMLKFHKFTIGWGWKHDYGNPEDPNDFAFLRSYSPYHNIKKGVCYPPILITTSDHDDRVVPSHSYKFAAQLQEVQQGSGTTLLRVYANTGHGQGRSLEQLVEEHTDILSFLVSVMKDSP